MYDNGEFKEDEAGEYIMIKSDNDFSNSLDDRCESDPSIVLNTKAIQDSRLDESEENDIQSVDSQGKALGQGVRVDESNTIESCNNVRVCDLPLRNERYESSSLGQQHHNDDLTDSIIESCHLAVHTTTANQEDEEVDDEDEDLEADENDASVSNYFPPSP